ncbi:MAG: NAD(P)/FAD-dependent oxidoreductase [Clostridiales bacterium]|nr:NAD(P)/FAD-dependent oxidoreductase [Candidatus Crickella caballi]
MAAKYDVVVVGSGNAGLSAAVSCVVQGKKTLLIEKHNLPGGVASSFSRGRFEFDPSVHEICDVGAGDDLGHVGLIMEKNGIDVDWVTVPDCYRCISKYSDGTPMDVTIPAGREAYIDAIEKYVPGSREPLEKFFDLIYEIRLAKVYMFDGTPNDPKYMQKHFPNTLKTCGYDSLSVMKALKIPQKAIDIIGVYWPYLGVPLDEVNFFHFGNMIDMYVTRRAVVPHHTSHEITMTFMNRFYELGGEAWFNCRAEEFLFDGDKICGVRTSMGDVECDQVLANINPHIIYANMMPKELVPEREKKLYAARKNNLSTRFSMIYFALNKSCEELGLTDYCVFFAGTADSRKEYENLKSIDNDYNILISYNNIIPDASPEGTCVISFTKLFSDGKDWSEMTAEEYYKAKDKMIEKCIEDVKKNLNIDITPYIEEVEVATPMTFARYLGTPEGTPYGFEVKSWDGVIARMTDIEADFNIKGLRHIGAGSFFGDGYSSTWINGDMTAGLACADLEEGGK